MARRKSRKVCPKLYFECGEYIPGYRSCRAYTKPPPAQSDLDVIEAALDPVWAGGDDGLVGEIDLEVDRKAGTLKVGLVEVDKKVQRCGVGTKLYEKALDHACELGLKLSSDTARTDMSEGFWRKQVRKRRARCAVRGEGAERLNEKFRPDGRWECRRYEIKASCPRSRSLAGKRRK